MRKPIGLTIPIQIETPEEKEIFSAMEQSSVRKETIRQPTKEAKLIAEVAMLTEVVRLLSKRVDELESKYEKTTN
jgi:NAD-dependent SIR2 family protein deacetylase